MFKIIDNFLDKTLFDNLQSLLLSNNFPWYFQENISVDGELSDLSSYGFSHVFYQNKNINSQYFETILPTLEKIAAETKTKQLLKARADLTVYNSLKFQHKPHVDLFDSHVVVILYMNNSTAETVIYKDLNTAPNSSDLNTYLKSNSLEILTTVVPKENRIVYFDGNLIHTGHSPCEEKKRVLLNYNLI